MSTFTPLRVRSHGSLLFGTASPEALVRRALELGCERVALADRDNLYLAIRFWQAARAEGLAPILGATIGNGAREALLIALDRRGYAHLCALITRRMLDPKFDLVAALTPSEEGCRAAGLHVIVESPALAAELLAAGVPAARAARGRPGGTRGDGGLWLGVRGLAAERSRIAERAAASRALGVPLVATGDCTLLSAADHEAHRAAVTAGAGELLERMPPASFCAREAFFAAPAEWERRVRAACAGAGVTAAANEALLHNRELTARCRLELDLGTPIFPRAPLPPGVTGPAHLRALGRDGVRRRYGGNTRAADARLDQELAMIERLGFTEYFLLVAEIVGFAHRAGIPTVGRGSGASSIVAYVLGITNVDPIRYGLSFERFLNPSRRDCPDLDIDLCWKRRDEVIDHVYRTYGDDRVAMISTQSTLGARSAFRETAKVLGVPNGRVNALARRIPRDLAAPYRERLREVPGAGAVDWSEPVLARTLALAERLAGSPRHLSVHSGGVVIADRELTHYVPLERAAKQIVVTQFEMRAIEAIGLVKMDLLGNRALSTIGECVEIAQRRGARVNAAALERIDGDPATSARIAAGDTLNCFQLESPAMRHLLRMLDARSLDDTIAAVALVRPGPAESGMKEAFCRRARGLERAAFPHPRLEPVLGATHGLMLYEEDVMHVAAALIGISLAEGDDLRRAIGAARDDEEFRSLERGFTARAAAAGIDGAVAHAVWCDLARFAAYAFCKAHAAGYGVLGHQCAYLKEHFPTEFAVAILNHHAGMYATWVHVEDLRRQGVEFLAPCALRSEWDTTLGAGTLAHARRLDPSGAPRRIPFPAVRVGLSRVFGLHEDTARRIVAARRARRFHSLADLIERVRPSLPEVENLVLAGALDWTRRTRPSLLLEARAGARAWSRAREPEPMLAGAFEPTLPGMAGAFEPEPLATIRHMPALAGTQESTLAWMPTAPVAVPDLPEFNTAARVRGECAATGLWFAAHPLDVLAAPAPDAIPAAEIEHLVGRRVVLVGMPCASRRVEVKTGGLLLFLTVADRTGLAECVLLPDVYRAMANAVRAQIVRVEGRVEEKLGTVTVRVEKVVVVAVA